jgi:uncharacterized protein (DUF433 family)
MRKSIAQIANAVDAKGIYTAPVAARLLHETPATVRRWAFGYRRQGMPHAPAIRTDVPSVDGEQVITFVELVELMFVQALLRSGLSWPKVREASRVAARLLADEPHPFATRRWFADAAAIYLRLGREHDEELLVEVAGHAQVAMGPVLRPFLTSLEFDRHGLAERWYPLGATRPVVLDPLRSFGMPVTLQGGVPTDVIARLRAAGDSISTIASWYELDEVEVRAALEFEESLAAGAA